MTGRGLRRHLDDLLAGRRPRPFRPTPSEADELRVAIALRAARPGADEPRAGFVDELHARLAAELGAADVDPAAVAPGVAAARRPPSPRRGTGDPRSLGRRRLLVQGAGLAAASAAVGAAVGSRAHRPRCSRPDGTRTITPIDRGRGTPSPPPPSCPRAPSASFDLGTVAGFVHRVDGAVRAVSAVVHPSGLPARPRRGAEPRLPLPHHRLRPVRRV